MSEPHLMQLIQLGISWDRHLGKAECEGSNEKYWAHLKRVIIRNKVSFASGGPHPTAGAWTERFEVTRCGETAIYTALGVAQASGPPRLIPMLPGLSEANEPVLLRDVLGKLHAALGAGGLKGADVAKGCKDIEVRETAVVRQRKNVEIAPGEISQVITDEEWTVDACGERLVVLVNLMHNPKLGGTTFQILVKE